MIENVKKYLLLWFWNPDGQMHLLELYPGFPTGSVGWAGVTKHLFLSCLCFLPWGHGSLCAIRRDPKNKHFSLFPHMQKLETSREIDVWAFSEVEEFSGTESHGGPARPGSPAPRTSQVAEPDGLVLSTCIKDEAFPVENGKIGPSQ